MGTEQTPHDSGTVAGVGVFYFAVSVLLVIFNKIVLSGSSISVAAPMFIVWFQLLVTWICLIAMGNFGARIPMMNFFPPFEFAMEKATKLIQLSVIFLGMMVFNNLCLFYVEVSFYQVARALTILFNIVLSQYMMNVPSSMQANQACAVVVIGFIIGCLGEPVLSIEGVIFGLISSIFVALYSIHVKRVLPIVDGSHWKLMMYTTTISLLLLIPIIFIVGEFHTLRDSPAVSYASFWFAISFTGLLSFLINIAIFLQIIYTTPTTQNISGTIKAAAQTLIAILYFQNEVTLMGIIGIALVIAGSYWYSQIRLLETQLEAKQKEEKENNV